MGRIGINMALSDARRQQVIDICRSLVQIKSYSGDERAVIDRVVAWMRVLGYEDIHVDECGNATGVMRGSGDATVLFDSHVDTVNAGDLSAWTHDPFGADLSEGCIWGRGSTDMKGSLAACLVGVAAAKEAGTLRGTVIVSASTGEEIIEGLTLYGMIDRYQPDVVVICEPSGLNLNIAQRGRAEITVTVHGKSSHASTPQLGINALRQMSKLVLALDTFEPPQDAVLGRGILEPTELITAPYPSVAVLPYQARARYDRRLLMGETEGDVLTPIHAIIERLHADDPTFRADANIDVGEFMCYTGTRLEQVRFAPAWTLDRLSHWATSAQTALIAAGQTATFGHYNFCTNGSLTMGRKHIPTLGYGPGYETTAHITDEYLALDQLLSAAEGYAALAGMG